MPERWKEEIKAYMECHCEPFMSNNQDTPLNFSMRIQDYLKKLSSVSFLRTIPVLFNLNETALY